MGRRFRRKSRQEVKYADENRSGGRNRRKTTSGSSSYWGSTLGGTNASARPLKTSRIGYGMRILFATVASAATAASSRKITPISANRHPHHGQTNLSVTSCVTSA